MSAELGTTDDPRVLVPGDPAGVAADGRALSERALAVARTGEALRRIGTGAWTGPASDAWREHHDEDAVRWFRAADGLDAAARALAGHADTLRWARSEAARAVAVWRAGEAATVVVPAPPVDPGDDARRSATEILAAARAELQRSGGRVASVLRGEAVLAPRDSQAQIDADFYGGMWDSISGAAEGAWTLVSDPAVAVAGAVRAAAHPVDTARDAIAYDDWTGGREPRALGRNAGDLVLGAATLGVGKIASTLGRETRVVGEADPPTPGLVAVPRTRSDDVSAAVLRPDGMPHGAEDSERVFLVGQDELEAVREDLARRLGAPDHRYDLRKGRVESWVIDPEARTTVTYRTFSGSGGATIDVNLGPEFPVKRFHVAGEGS